MTTRSFDSVKIITAPPQCKVCEHWHRGERRSCAAFASIPAAIWSNQADHRKPYEGDGGTRFTWMPREELATADLSA